MEYDNERLKRFRETFDRLPDEIALAIGLRVFDLTAPESCVCGWALREAMARELNLAAEDTEDTVASMSICMQLAERFGGDWFNDWRDIFIGVVGSDAPLIEEALFDRVMAAAEALV